MMINKTDLRNVIDALKKLIEQYNKIYDPNTARIIVYLYSLLPGHKQYLFYNNVSFIEQDLKKLKLENLTMTWIIVANFMTSYYSSF